MKLEPKFKDLDNPEAFLNHIAQLTAKSNAVPHSQLLKSILDKVEPLDFESLAFPQVKDIKSRLEELKKEFVEEDGSHKSNVSIILTTEFENLNATLNSFKLSEKHFLVLSIEELIKIAQSNCLDLCKNYDFIYLYNGEYWKEVNAEEFQKFISEVSELQGVAKWNARYFTFRERLFKQFVATAYLPTPEPDLSRTLINLQNGTFEITANSVKLKQFEASDFLTYQLPFEYDPNAKAPMFETYLNKVLPDLESQRVLAEYLGFVFIKHGSNILKEEKVLILYGSGANGKSVMFEIITALLGNENISNCSLQDLTNESGYHRAIIANKLVNYASEINGKLDASIFKQLASGEPVSARLPYGKPFDLKSYAKLIFNCNGLPKDTEQTNAFFRRFLIIPFNVTISEEEQDKTLHRKIIDNELSGVFNWILEGLHRLLKQGRFSNCEASNKALELYKKESNSVHLFIEEYNYLPKERELQSSVIYGEYKDFCYNNGFKYCNTQTFSDRLKTLGFEKKRKNTGNIFL